MRLKVAYICSYEYELSKKGLFHTCIIIKRTCISIFSKITLVDTSKPCASIYLQKMQVA